MSDHIIDRTGDWQVIIESSDYWDVAEKLQGLVAPTQTLSEIAYSPVCRVNKHAPGKENLARILAVNDLLAACEMAMEHVVELEDAWLRGALSETDYQGGTRSNRNVDIRVALSAAIAKARGEA
jgi:hypothetical protein